VPSRLIRSSFLSTSVSFPPESSKGVIEGEGVERKVAKFERYSRLCVSRLWGARDDLLAFDKVLSDDLVEGNGGKSRRW